MTFIVVVKSYMEVSNETSDKDMGSISLVAIMLIDLYFWISLIAHSELEISLKFEPFSLPKIYVFHTSQSGMTHKIAL